MQDHWQDDSHATEIISGLLVGGTHNAKNTNELRHWRVGLVINLVAQESNYPRQCGIKYETRSWRDCESFSIVREATEIASLIHEALQSQTVVLVHCRIGSSRSVAAVMAYLILKRHLTVAQALNLVQTKRGIAHPDKFLPQLSQLAGRESQVASDH